MRIVKEAEERRNEILDVAEELLLYSAEVFDAQNELTNEQMLERMNAFIYNTERLLGAKSGSMTESMKQIFV